MLTEYLKFGVASPLLTRPENIMNSVIPGLSGIQKIGLLQDQIDTSAAMVGSNR
jgi:hypothetical protein